MLHRKRSFNTYCKVMDDVVIQVSDISKRYRIGVLEKSDTFVDQLKNSLLSPIRNLHRIYRLNKFNEKEDPTIFWALQNVNFEVRQGEVLGIIGHNGAGKSTLLKILSRITEPTTGEITIKGRVASLLEVGTGFHPELTGRDNIYMNGTILGMTRREISQKFDEMVAFAGIEKHIDTPVKFYSSGMTVRLGFSVAAHLEPEILIIDEVLAVGDIGFQQKCIGKMNEVSKSGRTVLFVSHNISAVRSLCTKSILLNRGQISYVGNTEDAISHYQKQTIATTNKNISDTLFKNNDIHIKELRLFNYSNTAIKTGDSVVFSLSIYKITGNSDNVRISYILKDMENNNLMTLNPDLDGKVIFVEDGESTLNCKIDNLPLDSGRYLISATIKFGNLEKMIFDRLLILEVENGTIFSSGKYPIPRSLFQVYQDWRLTYN